MSKQINATIIDMLKKRCFSNDKGANSMDINSLWTPNSILRFEGATDRITQSLFKVIQCFDSANRLSISKYGWRNPFDAQVYPTVGLWVVTSIINNFLKPYQIRKAIRHSKGHAVDMVYVSPMMISMIMNSIPIAYNYRLDVYSACVHLIQTTLPSDAGISIEEDHLHVYVNYLHEPKFSVRCAAYITPNQKKNFPMAYPENATLLFGNKPKWLNVEKIINSIN